MNYDVYLDVSPTATSVLGQKLVRALVEDGHSVKAFAIDNRPDENFCVEPHVVTALRATEFEKAVKIVSRPLCGLTNDLVDGAIVHTISETDSITDRESQMLNLSKFVIVPTDWLKAVYRRCGVVRPIKVVNIGVSECYTPSVTSFPRGKIFLTAGNTQHGVRRKSLDKVLAAFLLAFPSETDVVLQVKVSENSPLPEIVSGRIQVIRGTLPISDMLRWYQNGLVFVSGSLAEGWGMHQHEAMACGKSVIGCNFGGMRVLMNHKATYKLPYVLEKSTEACGRWAVYTVDALAAIMREVYENPVTAFMNGLLCARHVEHMTSSTMSKALAKAVYA